MPADIQANLESIQKRIAGACQRAKRSPGDVTLVAVTKTVDPVTLELAYNLGIRNFAENRVQEAEKKIPDLPLFKPHPSWHMIGHLQSNKVKKALELFDIIHSVDSLELAEAIDRRAIRRIPVLLQVNLAAESTKSGFSPSEIITASAAISHLPNLEIRGLMTIAPQVEDAEQVRSLFRKLRQIRDELGLEHLSMGMTDDFEVAVEEGATMVRIGRALFGERT
jgi:PLP dependent protein